METKRTQRRKRVLINRLARKSKHHANRFGKFLSLNKIVLPSMSSDDEGWGFSDETGVIDKGGPVSLWKRDDRSLAHEKALYEGETMAELHKCKEPVFDGRSTKHAVVRVWPEDMVKLNWTGELVPWDTIKSRLTSW